MSENRGEAWPADPAAAVKSDGEITGAVRLDAALQAADSVTAIAEALLDSELGGVRAIRRPACEVTAAGRG